MSRVLGVALLLTLTWPRAAGACCCAHVEADDAVALPDFQVFTGRAVRYVETDWFSFALVEVDRAWTENVPRHVVLDVQVSSCGHPDVWTPGAENLFVTIPGVFTSSTNNCFGNEPLATAGPVLRRLGPGHAPRSQAPAALAFLCLGGGGLAAWLLRSRRRRAVRLRPG